DSNLLGESTYHYRVTALSFAGTGVPAALSATTLARPIEIFITVWQMPSSDLTLTFPSRGSYTIDWGDGTDEQDITSNNPMHTYDTAGDYTVTATNTITRFNLNNGVDKEKLRNIQQWGTANWTNMANAFHGASNMTMSASDSPDLGGVTNMSNMFESASVFNQDIGGWNVANVSNMGAMFFSASAFNQDIGSWNVAGVTDMSNIFTAARAFNQDIGDWNVGKVTQMNFMFAGANAFNQDIGDWNVASVTDMNNMFFEVYTFNQDIGGWNVASVTNMNSMFYEANAFNQNIGGWNVASVTNMESMFFRADAFNQNLGRWYVDETVDDLQTANSEYDGVNDLNVLSFNFVAQNTVLSDQTPTYTLAASGEDNARFTLASNTLSFRSDEATDGTYTVRIAVGGDFGSSNSIDLTIVVDAPPTVTSIVRTSPTNEITDADTLIWTLTFSKNVQNVDGTDFTVSGTTATATVTLVTGSDTEYLLTVTGGDLADL
ncbi:MAG: DUF285 domain-containing protein, partial [Methylococcales symbiont of Iophon sp. n. MRB-2018]